MADNDALLQRALFILDNVLPMIEDVEPSGECDAADGLCDRDELCGNWQCQGAGCAVTKAREIRQLLADARRTADEFIENEYRPLTSRETDRMLRAMREERADR